MSKSRYRFLPITQCIEHVLTCSENDPQEERKLEECLSLVNNMLSERKQMLTHERIRMRYEFLALGLVDLLKTLSQRYPLNCALKEQIDSFNNLRNKDEYNFAINDVDLNNHVDIFHAIYSQV